MNSARTAVITFPGSNCDEDLAYALEKVCGYQVTRFWHKDTPSFDGLDLVCLPGGFSYGDYLRCGAIAAHSPIMHQVKAFADKGGLVLGVCNGFQTLCESGLLPGALVRNKSLKFICKDVPLSVTGTDSPWTNRCNPKETLSFPIAHGEGRYVVDEKELEGLKSRGQILLKYIDNPNGSTGDIAGICNEKKNVFGLMPHPERAADLRSRDGMKIFESIAAWRKA